MLKILFSRIFKQKYRTGTFPPEPPKLPPDFRGRPVIGAGIGEAQWSTAKKVCPSAALEEDAQRRKCLDMGRCLFCGKCAGVCPQIKFTKDYRLGVFRREDLIVREDEATCGSLPRLLGECPDAISKLVRRSLKIREVSAGGCGACELDFNVLGTLAWDMGRFGISAVASPRHADALYLTGPVTENMKLALEKTFAAMPEPRFVIAAGACAISEGLYANAPSVAGYPSTLPEPVLFIPGCPPHPATVLDALLRLMGRVD